jgi:CheY-like chemotaxis protein
VTDTGAGIDPEALPRIFTAFEQADSSRTRLFGGLGLGLAIVRALVVAHGGTVRADSPGKGKGATFTVDIPSLSIVGQKPSAPSVRMPQANSHSRLRVLLVEDHDRTLALLTQLLQGLGHDVRSAATVKQALEIAEKERIDLVISDLGLPDGSGLDVMRALRKRYGIKGIALSGFGMDDDIRRCMEAGFSKHLTKPIDLGKLESAIEQATN